MLLYYRKETKEQASYEYRIHKYIIYRYCSTVGIVHYNSSHYYYANVFMDLDKVIYVLIGAK
jgi:hypothetical protein